MYITINTEKIMKKVFFKTAVLALVAVGCVSATTMKKKKEKDERLKPFVGTIIGEELCSYSNVALLINFNSPENIGTEVYIGGNKYYNVVESYSISLDSLKIGDTISGTFMPDTSKLLRICDCQHLMYGVDKTVIINLK